MDQLSFRPRDGEEFEEEEDGAIIPITEWPVTETDVTESSDLTPQQRYKRPSSDYLKDADVETRKLSDTHKRAKLKETAGAAATEPLAFARVARWWRRSKVLVQDLPASAELTSNPNTKLFLVSRTRKCKDFMREECEVLKAKAENRGKKSLADVCAALASLEDWLQDYRSAMEHITTAMTLEPQNCEYQWLKEKLCRQCNNISRQKEVTATQQCFPTGLPKFEEVERISTKELTIESFRERFLDKGKPVILLDVVNGMTDSEWNLEFVKQLAGPCRVKVKKVVPQSVEWASLEESRETTVAKFIEALQDSETEIKDYLFDWSLPLHCPSLAARLALPKYFTGNFLQKTSPGSMYHDSWPSLFIAPAGVVSNLHVDAFASHFWMALFQGQKRWTFFPAEDTPCLYPSYFHSMDPVFDVDLRKPDLQQHPLLGLTKPKQCVLEAGELLFVPGGSPHFVENLTQSVAVSSNFVDSSNYTKVCEELRVNALMDPRAVDLLQQLQEDKFAQAKL